MRTSRTRRTGRSGGRARRSSGSSAARRGWSRSSTRAARSASAAPSRTCTSFVYLADVYVLETYRGRGLGLELVREMVEGSAAAGAQVAAPHRGRPRALPQARLRRADEQGDGTGFRSPLTNARAVRLLGRSRARGGLARPGRAARSAWVGSREARRHPDRTSARRARGVVPRRRHVGGAAGDAADGVDRVRGPRHVRLHADKGYEHGSETCGVPHASVAGAGRCVMTGP